MLGNWNVRLRYGQPRRLRNWSAVGNDPHVVPAAG
jgi:hypothetical protein